MEELDDVLNGTTSLAISHGDPIAPMRVVNKFAKQFNGAKFTIKAGFMDGKVLSLDEVSALAELPSKEVLQAQVLGTMLAPITSLAIVIKAIAEKKGGSVEADRSRRGVTPVPRITTTIQIFILGGNISWLLRRLLPSSKRLRA